MKNYYNEIDPFASEWLRELIKKGLIPDGEVDTRSIADVSAIDLRGFTQCHFFAGIGGWSHALALAGWPENRPIWTGSCPCQPFSVAGKGKGTADERHLWPVFFNLIQECRPPVVMGEQVAGKAGYGWLDGVRSDLEGEDYACRGVDIPACAVDAPHIRQRLYWCAMGDSDALRELQPQRTIEVQRGRPCNASSGDMVNSASERRGEGRPEHEVWSGRTTPSGSSCGDMADAGYLRWRDGAKPIKQELSEAARFGDSCFDMDDAAISGLEGQRLSGHFEESRRGEEIARFSGEGCCDNASHWSDAVWLAGADGKSRRVKPGVRLLADGVPNRVGRLRGYGNAIVPPLAAEVIKAFMDVT